MTSLNNLRKALLKNSRSMNPAEAIERYESRNWEPITASYNAYLGSYYPTPFKRATGRYVPVKGGRWKIRKYRGGGKPWRAWSDGKAKGYSRYFNTQQEAIRWATGIAYIYANYQGVMFIQELRLFRESFQYARHTPVLEVAQRG